jgi:rhamnopyranosyl-N-acetylglucosaminyl-diphospho-decaprenol beta-1,3/1,4-galactofuranosyltransferase
MTNQEKICAVVVTYNRKELLLECLEAIRLQTKPIDSIYIIDNASIDATPEVLLENKYITELPPQNIPEPWEKEFVIENLTNKEDIKIHYVRMNENTGGAGGFYEGVKRGYERDYDWLWLMDDDVISDKLALQELVKINKIVPYLGFLCSVVKGINGSSMNTPVIDTRVGINNYQEWNDLLNLGIVKVIESTFVSILLSRGIIEKVGYPIKDFFIWGDDSEYTRRISANYKCYLVGKSIVYHKRKIQSTLDIIKEEDSQRINNFFYFYRNRLIISRKYFTKKNTIKYIISLLKIIVSPKKKYFFKNVVLVNSILKGIMYTNENTPHRFR